MKTPAPIFVSHLSRERDGDLLDPLRSLPHEDRRIVRFVKRLDRRPSTTKNAPRRGRRGAFEWDGSGPADGPV